jgi:anti-sigma-K factor RskA
MNGRGDDAKDDAATLSGAYSLDALSAEESEHFEAAMAQSRAIRNEVTELTDTAVLLGMATHAVEPSASVRASILGQVASTPQVGPLPVSLSRETAGPVPLPGSDSPVLADFSRAQTKARARWFTRPVAALTAVAAAVILIVGGGVVAGTISNSTHQQAQANQLAAINAADDSQRIAATVTGGGTATLVWSLHLKSSALIVDGLGVLPTDKVYELWYIASRGARAAGTFTVDASGSTWRVLEGSMAVGDTVGVTIEPRGGSTSPTTQPLVAIAST